MPNNSIATMCQSSQKSILYIVATPIGNLGDITLRALDTLRQVGLIACEDTRVTRRLLNHFGIKARLTSYNDHASEKDREGILANLINGEDVALVSDAGTPLISDPGFKLVRMAISRGIKVVPIPGASSLTASLSAAGLPTDSFYFAGFMPSTKSQTLAKLRALKELEVTLVFFESAARLANTLQLIKEELGDRQCAICRELTKLYEECIRGRISEVSEELQFRGKLKGEIVLVVGGKMRDTGFPEEIVVKLLRQEMKSNSLKTAVTNVVEMTGLAKNEVYKLALKLL